MKVSELTTEYLADYLRLDEPGDIETREIKASREAAVAYAVSYTGLTEEEIDKYEDITAAVLILIADMFDNKNMYIDYKMREVNRAVTTILGMHQVNLL